MEDKKNEVSSLLEFGPQSRNQLYQRWIDKFPTDPPVSQMVFYRILILLENEERAVKLGNNLYCRFTKRIHQTPKGHKTALLGANGPTVVRIICPQPMLRDKK